MEALLEERASLKEWLASHDADHAKYEEKKQRSKALKAEIRELEEQDQGEEGGAGEEAGAEQPQQHSQPEKSAKGNDSSTTEDHSLRTLNEWKTATGHNYKCFIESIAEEKKEEEEDKDGKKRKPKKKGYEQGPFRCTLTAQPKKLQGNMFDATDAAKQVEDLTSTEAPQGVGVGDNKKEAKRLAAGALVASLSEEKFASWGLAGRKKAEKSSRFQKMEDKKPKALNMAEDGSDLTHPCIRVWGSCQFEDDCQYAKFPYNTCLSFLKGKCKHGSKCVEPHDADVNDPKYHNNTPKPRPTHDRFSGYKREKPDGGEGANNGSGRGGGGRPSRGQQGGGDGAGCFNCGQPGHMSRECPSGKGGRGRGGGGGNNSYGGHERGLPKGTLPEGLSCFHCGETSHLARDCPTGDGSGCFKCGEPGHMSKQCPHGGADKCFKCGEEGHMSRDCPTGGSSGGGRGGSRGGRGGSGGRGGGGRGGAPPRPGGRWGLEGRGFGYGDDNRPSKYQRLELGDDDE